MLSEEPVTVENNADYLLSQIASGDHSAEQQLVSLYWRSLYFILNRRANDPDLAADITQEAFLVVIKKARNGEINKPESLSAFIRQVGVNLLIASYRKEKRHKTETREDIQIQFPDPAPSSATKLNTEQVASLVSQMMSELPTERDREILQRYFVYGQDKLLICREYELDTKHFDRVLFRARSRLKQLIQHKLRVDLSKVSLSHLLSVLFILVISDRLLSIDAISSTFFHSKVRDFACDCHLIGERPWEEVIIGHKPKPKLQNKRWR